MKDQSENTIKKLELKIKNLQVQLNYQNVEANDHSKRLVLDGFFILKKGFNVARWFLVF